VFPEFFICTVLLFAASRLLRTAFALAIVADGQGPAYPGIPGHEPSVDKGRQAATRIDQCVNQLRAVAGQTGADKREK
jgi:hypothetical protein